MSKTFWILILLILCFGLAGRIDYEAELSMSKARAEYADHHAAKVASAESRK